MGSFLYRARFTWDHRWAPGQMSGYLDGELAWRRRVRLERHVGECPECRLLLAGLQSMLDGLHRMPAPSGGGDPRQIAASVRRRLSEPPSS